MEINKTTKRDLYMIDPRNIVVEEGFNSRRDFDLDSLVEQIKKDGVLNPITTIQFKDENGETKYRLVDGERRYRATLKAIEQGAEIARIPTLLVSKSLTKEDLLVQQLLRNEGKKFNEYEMAIACQKFINWGWTIADISKRLSVNCGCVSYWLQHLERDENIQNLLRDGFISGAEVRSIYKAHKDGDGEKGAVDEILKGAKQAKKDGKKKMSIKDLSLDGKTIIAKDTATIKKGLAKLMEYIRTTSNKYEEIAQDIDFDVFEVWDGLKKGKQIDQIFEDLVNEYREAE